MSTAFRKITLVFCAAIMAFVVAGCTSSTATTSTQTDDAASQNRQYMSQLNQQSSDLQTALQSFSDAVAQNDLVTMNAQMTEVDKVVDSVKNTPATDDLQEVKDKYVDGLCTTDDALKAYVTLFEDVQAGTVDQDTYDSRLTQIQQSYDDGISKLSDADAAVKEKSGSDQ